MLLTSFFAVAMYRHNVLENAAIAAIAAQRWQAAVPKFPTIHLPSELQWLLCKHGHGVMQRQVVAKEKKPAVVVHGIGHGDWPVLLRGHVACSM